MAIKVTKPGELPKSRPMKGTCCSCKCELQCLEGDAQTQTMDSERNVTLMTQYTVPCPTPGCGRLVYVEFLHNIGTWGR